ncbi:hypothetical protein HPB50_025736 [Hyalomma asiaticum]|uniref:Uncharacterized protein n=1 Tax=Hyalomma asiaticum TaxID=266040 RepID=A0ACB7TPD7_HYAAI|nr:hypothetical protein HPB50_025736 [Hyalomma asiaticum]
MGAFISCIWPQCVDGIVERPMLPVMDYVPPYHSVASNIREFNMPPPVEPPVLPHPPPQHRNATRSRRVAFRDQCAMLTFASWLLTPGSLESCHDSWVWQRNPLREQLASQLEPEYVVKHRQFLCLGLDGAELLHLFLRCSSHALKCCFYPMDLLKARITFFAATTQLEDPASEKFDAHNDFLSGE